jgi:uncharacterized repeat protein (TIGR01451 family)
MRAAVHALVALAIIMMPGAPALADLRSAPVWYDQNAVAVTPDWHYRVPVTVAAGAAVNSTVKVDVDFAALLAQMNVSGTLDVNSPRVVRASGALSTTQEFTDVVYAGATDTVGNGRGEVRFIAEDAGPATYYIYFDVTQNGAKPVNPQTPINGNFERGAAGTAQPTGWNAPTGTAGLDSEVRPSETVSVTTDGAVLTKTTDGSPNTGAFSYLIGARSANETGTTTNRAITRNIVIPATNQGNFVIRWRPEGWDSVRNATSYDVLNATLTFGATTTQLIGQSFTYTTAPSSPNVGAGTASATAAGYGQYNGFDCNTAGVHTGTPAGTMACGSEPWFTSTVAIPAAMAGQTVTLTITSNHTNLYRSWFHIDDVEWSVSTGTLGIPQAFGVNISAPIAGGTYVPNQVVPITAVVDANPTAATNPVTANVYDSTGAIAQSGIILYNDGTHGDAVAGDAIWSNDGSIVANPSLTIPSTATASSNWTLRVFAKDATTATGGQQSGLAHINGQPVAETQANYWNIDDVTFNVTSAGVVITKTSTIVNDPVNGTTNPKAIPGAKVNYCILVTNNGPASASTIIASDSLPGTVTFQPGTMKSGTSCATAAAVEDDNNTGTDESDPIGASFSAGSVIAINGALANGATMAITFDVLIQ